MTLLANFERLESNDNPTPQYATPHSAGLDMAACLTRECIQIDEDGTRRPFFLIETGNRSTTKLRSEGPPILILKPKETIMVPLGWKCEFNNRHVMKLYIRSSLGLKGCQLANSVGIVDADYRGELFACLYNRNEIPITIKHGDRIVQAIFVPYSITSVIERPVDTTQRGEGGFGSTGQ